MSKYLVSAIILFLNVFAFTQADKDLYFDYLTIQNKLSHNSVYDIAQDNYGYIWLATQNGLNKYDGYRFSTNHIGFKGKNISSLFVDSNNNLWVGTQKNGINIKYFGSYGFINYNDDPIFQEIKGADISSFYEDRDGHIWITTIGKGIAKYNPTNQKLKLYNQANSGLSDNITFDVIQDNNSDIWVIASGFGIHRLVGDKFEHHYTSITEDPKIDGYRKKLLLNGDIIWIGTEGTGLYKFSLEDFSLENYNLTSTPNLSSNTVRDLFQYSDDVLAIATDGGGLNLLNVATNEVEKITPNSNKQNGLNSKALNCFFNDKTNNLWIGTFNGGVNILKRNKTWFDLNLIKDKDGNASSNSILAIYEDENKEVFLGTDGVGIRRYGKTQEAGFSAPSGQVIKSIFKDSKGEYWFGMYGAGLDRYNRNRKKIANYNTGTDITLGNNNVWSICESEEGNLWIGTLGGGISVLDQNRNFLMQLSHEPDVDESISSDEIMVLHSDEENNIWIGTANNGIDVRSMNGEILKLKNIPKESSSLSDNEVRAIYQDTENNIWVGTEGGGLNKYLGNGKFQRIQKKDGLIANSVMGISQDKIGRIWITTFAGISVIQEGEEIRNFNFNTQSRSNQFNQMANHCTEDGLLLFGGINGLNTIHQEKLINNDIKSELIFTRLEVFGKEVFTDHEDKILAVPIEEASDIYLNYSHKSFSLSFADMDYTYSNDSDYQYRLNGFDTDWKINSNTFPGVTYTNLDAGDYVFEVKKGDSIKAINIHLSPPFWKTLWFVILVILLSALLLFLVASYFLYKWSTEHKRQLLEAERKILTLKNENLESDVKSKNSKLLFSSAMIARNQELLNAIKEDLLNKTSTDEKSQIRSAIKKIDIELKNEDYWQEFQMYFDQVDKNFINSIIEKHPDLTRNDLRLCGLLRLNLSSKEIASLLNISIRGVEKGRYRLKKRMELSSDTDLSTYVLNFKY